MNIERHGVYSARVRFFRASRGKTAHEQIGTQQSERRQNVAV